MSDAYIVAPGGIGTLLEATMIWQLLQFRQLDVPLVFPGPMWRGLVNWTTEQMLRPGFELISERDLKILICVDTADEAVQVIREHQSKWLAVGTDENVARGRARQRV